MPYRRKRNYKKKPYTRKRYSPYKKSYRKRYTKTKRQYTQFLTSPTYNHKLKFSDYLQISRYATEDYGYSVVKMNSMVSPIVGTAASVIQGVAPLADIWQEYCIHACKIEIQALKLETSVPLAVYIFPMAETDTAVPPTINWYTITEQARRGVRYKTLSVGGSVGGDTASHLNTTDKRCIVKGYYKMKDYVGIKDIQDQQTCFGLTGAHEDDGGTDPAILVGAMIGWVLPPNYHGYQPTLDLLLKVTYYVHLFTRKNDIPNPSSTTSGSLNVRGGINITPITKTVNT